MNLVALKQIEYKRKHILFALLMLVQLSMGVYYLQGYIPWRSANFIIAVCGLPFIIAGSTSGGSGYRFLVVATVFGGLSFFIHANTILFLTFVFSCLALVELFYGRISVIPLLIILLLSPLSHFIAIFSFPVRLWLTAVAAKILGLTGATVVATGNIIYYAGNDYAVDPACMGLKMLATSLWLSLYLLHFIQKARQRYLNFPLIVLVLCCVFILNIITNLARIVTLVYFNIPPANSMHGITGLICFLVYTILPLFLSLQWMVNHFGRPVDDISHHSSAPQSSHLATGSFIALIVVLLSAYNVRSVSLVSSLSPQYVAGYTCDMHSPGILRLKNNNALIYLKKIPACYSSEHNPLMCWVGSGYEFEQLKETKIVATNIYTGTLRNGNDVLYTAWWYDNGNHRTISQFDWRWNMFTGRSGYSVVNITSNTQLELEAQVHKLLEEGTLNNILTVGIH